jgi:MFS superfamily sulfate permease-like transporter
MIDEMQAYQVHAAALVLIIGVIFLVAGIARLGWVTQFLSKPVTDVFVTSLAIFVAVGQLNKLFGVEKGAGNTFQKLFAVIKQLPWPCCFWCRAGTRKYRLAW